MKIAFDLDGVLVNLMDVFDRLLYGRYGKVAEDTGSFEILVDGV